MSTVLVDGCKRSDDPQDLAGQNANALGVSMSYNGLHLFRQYIIYLIHATDE